MAGIAVFIRVVSKHYGVESWLAWDLLSLVAWQALLAAAILTFGHVLILRVFKVADAPPLEALSLALGVGAVAFVMGMYAGGFLGVYGPVFAVALPGAMIAGGAKDSRRLLQLLRGALFDGRASVTSLLVGVFGVVGLFILYLGILSPDAVNYDASWNHLVIAQDYAREGRIVPFPGDWVKNVPHLGSIVNTWSFLVPGLRPPALRWMMALHTEFSFFLGTLVGVAALVDWAIGRRVRGAWAVILLFPGLFVYDGNMGGSADHFIAFFAPPLVLAAVRAARVLDVRACALTGVMAAGASLTKLHAFYLLAPLSLVLGFRAIRVLVKKRRAGAAMAPTAAALAAGAGVFVALCSPHFLANWIWFGNPGYPLMQDVFRGTKHTFPDGALLMKYLFADWRWHPPVEIGERIKEAGKMAFTFSLQPHYSFAKDLPVFGSLFTLSLPLLITQSARRRVWLLAAVGFGAVLTWALTFWVDRNLQTFLPVLAASAAATLVGAWNTGRAARVGVSLLIGAQAVWGADLMFSGADRIQSAIALIRSGQEKRASGRYDGYRGPYVQLAASLPKDAVVLLHQAHISLGLNRKVLLDWIGFQGVVDYRALRTPRDIYDRFVALGVTHIVAPYVRHNAPTKQEQVLFAAFLRHAREMQNFPGLRLFEMPKTPPPAQPPLKVLCVGLASYADGIYLVQDLATIEMMPPALQHFAPPRIPVTKVTRNELAVDAVVMGSQTSLDAEAHETLRGNFDLTTSVPEFSVYLATDRKPPPERSP